MADIDLRKIQPGQKASDVSNDLSYNFNALLSEIQVLKTEINQLKSGSNIQFDGTVNSTVVVNCAPTNILAMTGESKNVDIVLKVTNNNRLTDKNIIDIVDIYTAREDKEQVAKVVSNEDIANNDYNLSVTTYIEKKDTREKINIVELNKELDEIVKREQILRDEIKNIISEIEV